MLIDVQLAPPLNCSALSGTRLVLYMEVTFEARSLDVMSTLFLTTDEIRKHVCLSIRLYGLFFKGGMSWSACTNLISSVSTTLHVPMRRRGTDRMHSMGGFCCCSQRSAWLYSHLCSTDDTNRHNTVRFRTALHGLNLCY